MQNIIKVAKAFLVLFILKKTKKILKSGNDTLPVVEYIRLRFLPPMDWTRFWVLPGNFIKYFPGKTLKPSRGGGFGICQGFLSDSSQRA